MPKFFISKSWGFAGDTETDVVEAATQEEAEQVAWEEACEQIETWAEPYDPEKHDTEL